VRLPFGRSKKIATRFMTADFDDADENGEVLIVELRRSALVGLARLADVADDDLPRVRAFWEEGTAGDFFPDLDVIEAHAFELVDDLEEKRKGAQSNRAEARGFETANSEEVREAPTSRARKAPAPKSSASGTGEVQALVSSLAP
jgi:hypothetical protein